MSTNQRATCREYKRAMLDRFMCYRSTRFGNRDDLFDPRRHHVFQRDNAHYNLFDPALDRWLPHVRRHRWFTSMGSSQALAVSVFGLVLDRGDLSLLCEVLDELGLLLPGFVPAGEPEFDYKVKSLHEPRPTQVDLFLPGQSGNIAIECKLWEDRLSPCSQVPEDCNGSYAQHCTLTENGTKYWQYIPQLFTWRANLEYKPCPIWKPYQLVRNVLAAAVDPKTGNVWGNSMAVLVHDANNPACGSGGLIDEEYRAVEDALQGLATLKRTTWQAVAGVLLAKGGYEDLLAWLEEKYRITA